MVHTGRAVVFENIDDFHARIDDDALDVDESCVLVLKNCGPRGYPGMAEVGNMPLPPKVLRKGITDMVRISDARMSGTAYGTVVLHTTPEAAAGGPLALVKNGDLIELDVPKRKLRLHVSDEELARRRAQWQPAPPPLGSGYWKLYVDHVLQADEGRGPRLPASVGAARSCRRTTTEARGGRRVDETAARGRLGYIVAARRAARCAGRRARRTGVGARHPVGGARRLRCSARRAVRRLGVSSRHAVPDLGHGRQPARLGACAVLRVPGTLREIWRCGCSGVEAGRIAIVPGLRCDNDGTPDVMRGEEVQIFGALQRLGLTDGLLVLPGTHSKWVRVRSGVVEGFATFMTGEFYALLRQHSILARSLPASDDDIDGEAFDEGVTKALRGPADLAHRVQRSHARVVRSAADRRAIELSVGSRDRRGAALPSARCRRCARRDRRRNADAALCARLRAAQRRCPSCRPRSHVARAVGARRKAWSTR